MDKEKLARELLKVAKDLVAGGTIGINEVRRDLKKLGFKVRLKSLSWGSHAEFYDSEGNVFPSMFNKETLEKWKPLIDYKKGLNRRYDYVVDKYDDFIYGFDFKKNKVAKDLVGDGTAQISVKDVPQFVKALLRFNKEYGSDSYFSSARELSKLPSKLKSGMRQIDLTHKMNDLKNEVRRAVKSGKAPDSESKSIIKDFNVLTKSLYGELEKRIYGNAKDLVSASYGVGNWIMQKQDELDNHYGYVVGELKNGSFKVIVAGGLEGTRATTRTTSGWHPSPIMISKNDVPDKFKKAIIRKAKNMNLRVARDLVSRGDTFYGKDVRITKDHYNVRLEELPAKGKKRLRIFSLNIWPGAFSLRKPSALIPENVVKFSQSSTFDGLKKDLIKGYKEAAKEFNEDNGTDYKEDVLSNYSETTVHYLKIEPKDSKPFVAQGKDFKVDVGWNEFDFHDPSMEMNSHDPSGTYITQKSSAGARKLYKMLRADPNVLKGVSWDGVTDWLSRNKVSYKMFFSNWR